VDVKHGADGWPIVGFIWMIDAFVAENGATRFVPGSHVDPRDPRDVLESAIAPHDEQVLACGPAGSLIIFNGSVWHSHTSNTSRGRRRSVQGHFVPREARSSTDHTTRLTQETCSRIGDLAKYVLDFAA
jgi:ectoine hydroxylase-related dioxygenase (phytanoyl-CoA dioxygenase family)